VLRYCVNVMIILQAMTRPVVNVGKPSVFARLFQAAVDIRIKQKLPKATAWFADVYSCGIFHRPFCVFFFGSFFF